MNRHWSQDRVFQESRKIVGSVMQAITYQEFLPALIGPFHARLVPPYIKYNPSINPGILNEFAAAAYRLHGMIQEGYPLLGPNFEDRGQISFLSGVGRIEQVNRVHFRCNDPCEAKSTRGVDVPPLDETSHRQHIEQHGDAVRTGLSSPGPWRREAPNWTLFQFLSHDITKNALANVCSCSSTGPRCANVPRPPTDPTRGSCVSFTRSIHVCGTGTGNRPREQYNENTAFIDCSSVYSSESVTLRGLRAGAMLKTHVVNGRTFPPNNRRDSMTVGDDRATIFIGLAAMHTTFLRLHNG
ncbi:hypothetical protein ANCCAN_22711 [Ancylostoma caninum]|uniref:Animal hem peroxidase n=1 Tax=Ancylostoma caninum TaxID=29170 RepID=A0A368FIY0_ANCCA|nr:hypothetical protein ANCCAN_22711 [Ancylostoma caninum]